MYIMPCTDYHSRDVNAAALAARARLKLLVLEADEQMMDKILAAIEMVCGADSEIRQ